MSTTASLLIAEDDIDGGLYLRQSLERLGYRVTAVARSGEEALESVAEEQPDLVLMDITLSGEIDGITTAAEIRRTCDIPIIYLTAHSGREVFQRAKGTIPHAYLVKPFELSNLQHAIELTLQLKESENRYRTAQREISQLNSELSRINDELMQEIVERKKMEKQLRHQADHDPLTGLPNRVLLFDRLKQAFAFDDRHNSLLALMLLDLDGFKAINDTLGHLSGDILLKKVAKRLQQCMRQYDTVGRIGGDEFVIVANDIQNVHDIIKFAEKIKTLFDQPFDILGQQVSVTTSIGVAIYPIHGTSVKVLMSKADTAMYAAKNSGKNAYCFYSGSMEGKESERNRLRELRRTVPEKEQPSALPQQGRPPEKPLSH